MIKKPNKGFSLVELSIVILIIGVLIAGVSQGIDLLQDSRLAAARMLTQSSRVNSIKNLVTWLETTSEKVLLPLRRLTIQQLLIGTTLILNQLIKIMLNKLSRQVSRFMLLTALTICLASISMEQMIT